MSTLMKEGGKTQEELDVENLVMDNKVKQSEAQAPKLAATKK